MANRYGQNHVMLRIWFFWRSDHCERVVQEAVDLENPLVVRFVNANDNDKLITFLSTFGFPEGFLIGVPGTKKRSVARFLSSSALPEEFLLGAPGWTDALGRGNFKPVHAHRLSRMCPSQRY
jgi:hypothetical protein